MGLFDFFKKFLRKDISQAVIIKFEYGKTDLTDLFALEDRLENFLEGKGIGDLDGHEIALDGSDGFLYLYGDDAQLLVDIITPILIETPFMTKAKVHLRLGDIDDEVKTIDYVLE